MQDCFRQHPDIYGSEIDEDELDEQLEEQRVELESSEPGSESKAAATDAGRGEQQPAAVKEEEKKTKDDSNAKQTGDNKEAR